MALNGAPDSMLTGRVAIDGGTRVVAMTGDERDALASPPDGLLIYNTSTNKLNVRADGGWEVVTSA